ncbi:hypothetical protein BLNAU_11895 [Blattamonas nauphoetae]|uniref:Uncharacterized protein n=1 Tax=Blattamonas nauphoetae TaxID=2049346 RepID=A0ABQ9XRZ7_9EUKA|nr:hypothetical protein BLNAU_11895 [Blattamonas nauphoetae]
MDEDEHRRNAEKQRKLSEKQKRLSSKESPQSSLTQSQKAKRNPSLGELHLFITSLHERQKFIEQRNNKSTLQQHTLPEQSLSTQPAPSEVEREHEAKAHPVADARFSETMRIVRQTFERSDQYFTPLINQAKLFDAQRELTPQIGTLSSPPHTNTLSTSQASPHSSPPPPLPPSDDLSHPATQSSPDPPPPHTSEQSESPLLDEQDQHPLSRTTSTHTPHSPQASHGLSPSHSESDDESSSQSDTNLSESLRAVFPEHSQHDVFRGVQSSQSEPDLDHSHSSSSHLADTMLQNMHFQETMQMVPYHKTDTAPTIAQTLEESEGSRHDETDTQSHTTDEQERAQSVPMGRHEKSRGRPPVSPLSPLSQPPTRFSSSPPPRSPDNFSPYLESARKARELTRQAKEREESSVQSEQDKERNAKAAERASRLPPARLNVLELVKNSSSPRRTASQRNSIAVPSSVTRRNTHTVITPPKTAKPLRRTISNVTTTDKPNVSPTTQRAEESTQPARGKEAEAAVESVENLERRYMRQMSAILKQKESSRNAPRRKVRAKPKSQPDTNTPDT